MDEQLTRRNTLLRFGGLIAAGLGVDALHAGDCPGAVAAGSVRCALTPEQTEGTYYIPDESAGTSRKASTATSGIATRAASTPDSAPVRRTARSCAGSRGRTRGGSRCFANGGKNSKLTVRSDGSGGYVAAIAIGVMRS